MLSFASTPGNIFNAIGKLGLLVKQVKSYQTSQQTNMTDLTAGVVAQLTAEPDIQALMGSAYLGVLSGSEGASKTAQSIAAAVLNRKVFRDNPQPNQTLSNTNTPAAIKEVIRQMRAQGATVLAMTVTAAPTVVSGQPGPHFNGSGNGVVVASVVRPFDGLTLENSFAETLTLKVSSDSYTGGATAGNERIGMTGQGAQTDPFAFNWPLGSGATSSINAVNGNTDNGQGNILTNSGFETWASSLPSSYTVDAGGSLLAQESTLIFAGSSALRITGDGTAVLQFRQQFGNSAGTLGTLSPLSQYAFNVYARRDGAAAGAGILTIDLVDANGTVIKDASGVANTFTVDLTALTTSYAARNAVFRTPNILPASQFLRWRMTTALTNGRAVYFDTGALGLMNQAYTSGPFALVFSGSVPFVLGDFASLVVTNSRGAAGTLSTFQTLWSQLFTDMIGQEFLLPSAAAGNTISDGLIG